jgi:hypothetical protein
MRWRKTRTCTATLLGVLLLVTPASAQSDSRMLRVFVTDADSVPLSYTQVIVRAGGGLLPLRTDDIGELSLSLPREGNATLEFKRIGYATTSREFALPLSATRIHVRLERVAAYSLQRVTVRGGPLFTGLVADRSTQTPVAGARISLGAGTRVTYSDSLGQFVLPAGTDTRATLIVSARGFATRVEAEMLVTGREEFLVLLDSLTRVSNRDKQYAFDIQQRMRRRGVNSAAIGARELRATATPYLIDALQRSPSMATRGLRVTPSACLFIDGVPSPGQTLESFQTTRVRLVEVYGVESDLTASLRDEWPKDAPCGWVSALTSAETQMSGSANRVAIWTKR